MHSGLVNLILNNISLFDLQTGLFCTLKNTRVGLRFNLEKFDLPLFTTKLLKVLGVNACKALELGRTKL